MTAPVTAAEIRAIVREELARVLGSVQVGTRLERAEVVGKPLDLAGIVAKFGTKVSEDTPADGAA